MVTELLSITLAKFKMVGEHTVQYADDIRVCGIDSQAVRQAGQPLREMLVCDGWIRSGKSVLEPDTEIEWMGKQLDGRR